MKDDTVIFLGLSIAVACWICALLVTQCRLSRLEERMDAITDTVSANVEAVEKP